MDVAPSDAEETARGSVGGGKEGDRVGKGEEGNVSTIGEVDLGPLDAVGTA